MRLSRFLFGALALVVTSAAFAFAAPELFGFDPAAGLALAMAAAAPLADRPIVAWGRKREPLKTFNNVAANSTCFSKIPRYPRTIHSILLERGGTTFTAAQLTRVEIFLGEKSIWGPISGTNLDVVERYLNGPRALVGFGEDQFWHVIDFTLPNVKEIGPEFIGGLDLTTLPDGELRIECDIGGATAPTLRGEIIWGPPQGGADLGQLMQKLLVRTYPTAAAGDFYPDVNVRGAIMLRTFFRGTVMNNAVTAAFTAANHGVANTGDGAMGTLAVAALTPVGRYKAVCIEPAANAGRFALFAPNYLGGYELGTFTVAVAFSIGGISGTLADGATDFVAGDGFLIDVLPTNTDGNINVVEVKKNEDFWWFRRSRASRFEQLRYGHFPMAGVEVADYILDNHGDSMLDTADAQSLDFRLNLTAQDTVTIIHQLLAKPTFGQ